ncbi:MAG TPA: hypothetical protein VF767_01160 [Bryobacteraceae bacterium]
MHRFVPVFLLCAAASWAADRDLLKLMMPDARVLSGVRVAQIKKTPFGKFVLAEFSASEDQQFDGFVKASGFDPRQHLDEIVIASPAGGSLDRRLVAARGAFDPTRFLELARSAGAAIEEYEGVQILSSGSGTAASPRGTPLAVAFLSGTIAVAGDLDSVREAVKRRSTGAGPTTGLAARVATVSASSDAWFVSKVPVAELAQGLPSSNLSGALKGDALQSIQQASGGATFGSDVKFSAELVTRTPEDAASLGTVVRFLSGLLRTGPQQPLVNALELKPDGRTLKLTGAIPEAQLESLIRQAGR